MSSWGAIFALFASGFALPLAGPAIAWQELAPGAVRATLVGAAGTERILLFRFDLDRYRAEVVVGPGWPPQPRRAADLVDERHGVAAVNGGFFDQRGAPLGLRVSKGHRRSPLRRNVDWGVLLLDAGHARIVHSRDLDPHDPAVAAIQVGPRLVVHGQPLTLKPQRARRTAVALEPGGDALTLVVVDGAIDANELAQRLAASGFDSAILLDGGPSTQIALELGSVHLDLPGGYGVPDLLLILGASPGPAAAKLAH